MQLAVTTLAFGEIGDPTLVRCLGGEVPAGQIRPRSGTGGAAAAPLAAAMHIHQAALGHYPGHPLAADTAPAMMKLPQDPGLAIGLCLVFFPLARVALGLLAIRPPGTLLAPILNAEL